ncbi:uncharacterized protein LOC107261882 [Ricinus communis]|uniref:uncharacterized protein LOC107261882 n=1 Tax=Ricinus communis TaxID=3988 RepID=UPI0007721B0C|nr:uncharacterized protein LOC107261882 [Ricinus communis]|eukprot:XP_015579641.1 uncharacterized protein LOC107261882 [Ricinus communis]
MSEQPRINQGITTISGRVAFQSFNSREYDPMCCTCSSSAQERWILEDMCLLSWREQDYGAKSRTNLLKEGGNDGNPSAPTNQSKQDPLSMGSGPITRARAKKLKDAMVLFVQTLVTIHIVEEQASNKPNDSDCFLLLQANRNGLQEA